MSLVKSESAKLVLKVQTGTNAKGNPAYAARTISGVNPMITEEDVYAIGNKLATLQEHVLETLSMQVTTAMSE